MILYNYSLHVNMGNAPDLCWHCFIQLSDPGSDRFITHGLIVLPLPILTTLNPYIGGGHLVIYFLVEISLDGDKEMMVLYEQE